MNHPRFHRFHALVGSTLLLSACVLTVAPIVPSGEATFDPRLLGSWEEVGGSDRIVVEPAPGASYAIEFTTGGETGTFRAHLGRLGTRSVLDVWPTPGDGDLPDSYAGLLVAGHSLFVVDIETDRVSLSALDPDSLQAALRAGRVGLSHTAADDRLILRGSTGELRQALGEYLESPGVLVEPAVFRRPQGPDPGLRSEPISPPCFEASAWREADELFRGDPHWVGGDGTASVDLGGGRILWLFGDSWIDPSGRGTRDGARMVSNSVAIQIGTDPTTASIHFYWGGDQDSGPAAFIPDAGDERHWFGNGVRVGERLVLFLNRLVSVPTGLGFESVGWTAWMVENPDEEPPLWQVREIETPANPLGVLVGFAAVWSSADSVYAFGSQDPVKSHPVFAVRWPSERVRRGDLSEPEWWAGNRVGWVADASPAPRWPLFENGQSALTVHEEPSTRTFLAFQTLGFGPADLMIRAAPALTGPWSAPRLVYHPPEYDRPNIMIYSARAHPELTGADLVLTYDTNTFEFGEHLSDPLIYYPRFVRLARCR